MKIIDQAYTKVHTRRRLS